MAKKLSAVKAASEITEEQVARCAYEIWESEGRPEGRAGQHWFEAEARLRTGNLPPDEARQPVRAPKAAASRRPSAAAREKRLQIVT